MGETGEELYVTQELDVHKLKTDLQQLKETGIDSIAVALAHSYTFHEHEKQIEKVAQDLGECNIIKNRHFNILFVL